MIDYSELRDRIRVMTPKQQLYKLLKEELQALGYWKNQPRGNPAKGKAAQDRSLSQG